MTNSTATPILTLGGFAVLRNGWVVGPLIAGNVNLSPYKFRCTALQSELCWTEDGRVNAFAQKPDSPFDVLGCWATRELALQGALMTEPTTVQKSIRYMLVSPSKKGHLRYLTTLGSVATLSVNTMNVNAIRAQPAAVFDAEWIKGHFAECAKLFGHLEVVYAMAALSREAIRRIDPDDPDVTGISAAFYDDAAREAN